MSKMFNKVKKLLCLLFFLIPVSCRDNNSFVFLKENKNNLASNGIELVHEDSYAYLTTFDGNVFFAFEGTYSLVSPSKETFKLVNDDESDFMMCDDIEIDGHFFVAYFNLTNHFYDQKQSLEHFYPHLYVDGILWDGYKNGDLLSSDGESNYSPAVCYKSDGNHQYYLRAIKDDYPMCEIYSYLDIDLKFDDSSDYVNISYEDNHYYYNINGHYDNDVTLVKESLSILDGDLGSYRCSSLILSKENDVTMYQAKFEIDHLLDYGIINDDNRRYISFDTHLYYNGDAYDKRLGYIPYLHDITSMPIANGTRLFRLDIDKSNKKVGIFASEILSIQIRDFINSDVETYIRAYPITLEEKDERVIFTISGHYSGTFNNYYLSKEALTITDTYNGSIVDERECEDIVNENPGEQFEGGTRFFASFDITDLKFNSHNNFWCHLYINGVPFDNDNGDYKPGAYANDDDWTYKTQVKLNDVTYSLFSCYGMAVFDIR